MEKPGYSKASLTLAKAAVFRPWLWFALLLGLVMALNYYDIIHTIELCASGAATEGNPLMALLLDTGPRLALTVKMGLALLFSLVMLIYARTHFKRAFLLTSLIALIYSAVALWHLIGMPLSHWLT